MQQLVTERLLLRQWQNTDFAPFAQLNADPQVMRYFPHCLSQQESDALGIRLQNLIAERGWGVWAVECMHTQTFIGFVGLNKPQTAWSFQPCVEIAWRLARPFWGKGYATEAASKVLQFGFEQLRLKEIVAFTSLNNQPSQAVMERLAMKRDPQTFMHPELTEDSPLCEHCLYRLPRQHWRRSQL